MSIESRHLLDAVHATRLAHQQLGVPKKLWGPCLTLVRVAPFKRAPVRYVAGLAGCSRGALGARLRRAGVPSPSKWAQLGTAVYLVTRYWECGTAQRAVWGSRISDEFTASSFLHNALGIRFVDLRGASHPEPWRWVAERWVEGVR